VRVGIKCPPVTIKSIECAIIDRGWDEGWVTGRAPKQLHGQKGGRGSGSGPAGLCAAAQLNKARPTPSPFSSVADRPGGAQCTASEHEASDKEQVVLRRIKQLRKPEGIGSSANTDVGGNYPAEKLAGGIRAPPISRDPVPPKPRDLLIEGRNLKGVHFAMEFLTGDMKSILDGKKERHFHFRRWQGRRRHRRRRHRNRFALEPRCGTAARVWCRWRFCQTAGRSRRGQSVARMAKVYKMDYGQEEAAAKFGADPRI